MSQANEGAIHPRLTGLCQHEIVSGIMKKWKQCGTVQASYGCLVVMCAWASVSQFLPHNSATLQFQVLISMQMDAYLKKEQIVTLFVWVGAPEGGVGGWVVGQGGPAQKLDVPVQKIFSTASCESSTFQ